MTGTVWAAASGLGFGVFQTLNRRAVAHMDVEVATFVQLLVATSVLVVLAAVSGDLSALGDAPASSLAYFVAGGLVHFFVGWTLLNASQKRIGAARTSPLIATVPIFGVVVAFVTLGELPGAVSWIGIALICAGAYAVALGRLSGVHAGANWRDSGFGLGTACAWAISPVLIRKGLAGFDYPLLGLTLGLIASVAAYAAALAVRRVGLRRAALGREALAFKLTAGAFVALSTWGRWVALDRTTVAVVLALGLLSIPVVLVFSPVVAGRHLERVTGWIWLGAALVIAGSLLLVVRTL
jgi:drug/metabolite transporter (DMT)-like permease